MLISKHSVIMIIFWGAIVVLGAVSIVAVLRSRQIVQAVSVQPVDSIPVAVPFVHVLLPGAVTLSPEQVILVFSTLETARLAFNTHPTTPAYRHGRPLDTYVYQLQAAINSAGDTEVQVYALPPRVQSDPTWQTVPFITRDGGADYFTATVNLSTATAPDFFVHGEA